MANYENSPEYDKVRCQDLLDYFQRLCPREIDLSLNRIAQVLRALGNPHHRLPPTIHVAGTNGKGSTISCLQSIYQAAGYRVHVYTSPHLIQFHERIRLAGELITDQEFVYYLSCVHRASSQTNLTLFEALTAAAFLAFSQIPADVLLLETGLGGRLDATNVLEQPLACVITPISLDHQDFLGNTIIEIAKEKAGIIKRNTPVFIADQSVEVTQVLLEKAQIKQAPVYLQTRDWQIIPAPCTLEGSQKTDSQNLELFQLAFGETIYPFPRSRLVGDHQLQNAGLAVAVAMGLKDKLPLGNSAVMTGLKTVEWPGRLQCLAAGPLFLPGVEIWLDGAHNEQGFQVLRHFIEFKQQRQKKKIVMGMAMLKNRDPQQFFDVLNGEVDHYLLIEMAAKERFHSPKSLTKYTQKSTEIVNIDELVKIFPKKELFGSRIFISGSLYLVGKVLELNKTLIA